MRRAVVFFYTLTLLALAPFGVEASTIRADTDDSPYTSLAAQTIYSGVGQLHNYGVMTGASGSLISPQWVLTAAHAVADAGKASNLKFLLNGTTYISDRYVVFPDFDSTMLTDDVALVHLSQPVTGVTYAALYQGTTASLLGQTATYVGYGCTGTGLTGYQLGTYGGKRAVQNVLDTIGTPSFHWPPTDLVSDFDSPDGSISTLGSSVALALEGSIAAGDSGGGVFATVGNATYLIGVISFLSGNDGQNDASYGDCSGCVSVAEYRNWISSTVVPEPSSLSLVAVAAVAIGFRLRRRR
ncbi:MAG: trypsin-like serine protease [Planctomycetaceae bacterium]|nr:trypsin-like serine protease [Planctomycetaceae bacterium]